MLQRFKFKVAHYQIVGWTQGSNYSNRGWAAGTSSPIGEFVTEDLAKIAVEKAIAIDERTPEGQ